jgi:hypothetical protein
MIHNSDSIRFFLWPESVLCQLFSSFRQDITPAEHGELKPGPSLRWCNNTHIHHSGITNYAVIVMNMSEDNPTKTERGMSKSVAEFDSVQNKIFFVTPSIQTLAVIEWNSGIVVL